MNNLYPQTQFLVRYRDSVTSRAGKFSLSTNEFYEIYTYIYGEGPYLYFVDDKIYAIEPGDVLLLRPGVLIGGCKKLEARYTRLVCKIPLFMVEFIKEIDPALYSFLSASDADVLKLDAYSDEYFGYVEELKVLSQKNSKHRDTLMFSVVLKMLVLLNKASKTDIAVSRSRVSDELIIKIIDKINKEYANISSVAELASKLNYSTNYISQYFKTRMNMGLHDFLITKKLSVAATKLIAGKGVTDVAFECGFGSTAYFISVFKARYGVTPGKYIGEKP